MAVILPLVSKFDDRGIKQAKSGFSGVSKSFKGMIGALGLTIGVAKLASELKQATKAAADDQRSMFLLEQQLRLTIGATKEQTASVEASIAKMEQYAAVADDQIRPAFASLVRATGDLTQANNLTTLALDVAAGTGRSLESVALALGKAVNGSTGALTRLVPSVKNAADPMAALREQFAGMAAIAADASPFQRIQIVFDNLSERIGMALLPYLQQLADYLASPEGQARVDAFVKGFADLVVQLTPVIELLGKFAKWLVDNAVPLATITAGIWAYNAATTAAAASTGALNVALTALRAPIAIIAGALGSFGLYAEAISSEEVEKATEDYLNNGPRKMARELAGLPPLFDAIAGRTKEYITNARLRAGAIDQEAAAIERLRLKAIQTYTGPDGVPAQMQNVAGRVNAAPTTSGGGGGVIPAVPKVSALKQFTTDLAKNIKIAAKESALSKTGLSAGLVDSILGGSQPLKTANAVLKKIAATGGKYATTLQNRFNRTAAGQAAIAQLAEETAQAEQQRRQEEEQAALDAAKALAEELKEKETLYAGFVDAMRSMFDGLRDSIMGAFKLADFGSTASKVIRNMDKTIAKLRVFSANIANLANMGLNATLLQQIISMGPLAGAKLAQSLVNGGAMALGAINEGYATFSGLAGQVAGVGTQAYFGTPAAQTTYSINIQAGMGTDGRSIGELIVNEIAKFEKSSGTVFVRA